jgi:hypothetical protein
MIRAVLFQDEVTHLPMTFRLLSGCIGLIIALVACAPEAQTKPEPGNVTVAPLSSRSPSPLLADTPSPLPGYTSTAPSHPVNCPTGADETGVQYEIEAVLDWPEHVVQVEQYVSYQNDTSREQDRIVFNVEPNRSPGQFALKRITTEDGRRIENYELVDARLTVFLVDALAPGCADNLLLEYTLTVPAIQAGYSQGHLGYWGYNARQVNLGMWLPLVAAFDGSRAWVSPVDHPIGEHFALQTADFVVDFQIKGGSDHIRVAGPGQIKKLNNQTWHFELRHGREFTLSVSENFEVLRTITQSKVQVELYYFPDPVQKILDSPRHTLNTAADALALYEELYSPYPYSRLVVVEGDFPDGMEFSGLVFVSGDWFRAWQGVPNDWLTLITAHEVAHQWWYALVGNDQGNYPYLDEALATYSEELFFERYYPEYVEWWWDFRVATYTPSGFVDSRVYEFTSVRGYINAVYLQGARMMQALRDDLGDEGFFTWMQEYARRMQGQMATPPDFWGSLSQDGYRRTQTIRDQYLKQADVLLRASELP